MFFANIIFPAGLNFCHMHINAREMYTILFAIKFSEYLTSTFFSIVFWGAMIFITLCTMVYYGSEFVDYPQLIPLDLRKSQQFKHKENKYP
jgi:hypothetical protein